MRWMHTTVQYNRELAGAGQRLAHRKGGRPAVEACLLLVCEGRVRFCLLWKAVCAFLCLCIWIDDGKWKEHRSELPWLATRASPFKQHLSKICSLKTIKNLFLPLIVKGYLPCLFSSDFPIWLSNQKVILLIFIVLPWLLNIYKKGTSYGWKKYINVFYSNQDASLVWISCNGAKHWA